MTTPNSSAMPAVPEPSISTLLLIMASLLISYACLMAGNGLFGTLIGLRANFDGFSTYMVGILVAAHFSGLVLGSLRCGPLINRIGHIRAFAAFSSLIASVILFFPFVSNIWIWAGLRVIIGFNLAGVFMVTESWLNHKSAPRTRGTMLALYMMTSYLSLATGQFMIGLAEIGGTELFMLAAMLFGLAVVPVAVTRSTYPPPVEHTGFSFKRLYAISPVAFASCLGAGLATSTLWGLGPIFGRKIGMSTVDVSQFMGAMILGAMILQYPVGKLSDRFDRRAVILAVCVSATLVSAIMVTMLYQYSNESTWPVGWDTTWIYHRYSVTGIAVLYGGVISTLYPLSVAYANDYVEDNDIVALSGGLVLVFGVGAAIGPLPAGWLMHLMGAQGLFVYIGIILLTLSTFILFRMRRRSWAKVAEKDSFVALPEATSTPSALEVDPRIESGP